MEKEKRKISIDPVLCVAFILAVVSAFIIRPGKEYIGYIDFRSLGILWGLMVVIQGLKENTVFEKIATALLSKVKNGRQLSATLVFLCFFSSMLITNDVALITFVPFALMMLSSCKREDLTVWVVILQTVAANLGSMLTPLGNPQNLYLYGASGLGLAAFLSVTLPYTILAFVLIAAGVFLLPRGKEPIELKENIGTVGKFGSNRQILIYAILFALALLTVLGYIPWYISVAAIFIVVLGMDFKILFRADYILLLTFIGFFIFTGNLGRIDRISDILRDVMSGREFFVSILASQVISNVPATFLLIGFVSDIKEIIAGVNVGGLGTLIASMASLISYKNFANEYPDKKGAYLLKFTVINIIMLLCMILLHQILGG
ncbi:MAG: citrate transporter [Butyrivibrio sp.]|nr:citrate transporter [Butyrivibrio sp.]